MLSPSLKGIAVPGFFSESTTVIGSFLAILFLAWLDIITGPQVSLHALYLLPLTLCALHSSRHDFVVVAVALSIALQLMTVPTFYSNPSLAAFIIATSNCAFALFGRYIRISMLKAERLSTTDPLTQLFNRRALEHALHTEITRQHRYGGCFSVALIDLDGFKKLNDSMGHEAGDKALTLMAQILRNQTRQSDTIARLGGDEFVIIMPNTHAADCEKLCQALCHQVDARMRDVLSFPITASIGYTTIDYSDDVSNDVLIIADKAMYQAKSLGKGCVVRGYRTVSSFTYSS